MITLHLICEYCNKEFDRTDFPSRFQQYRKFYCSKRCAMLDAREHYRPTQITILANNNHFMVRMPNHPNRNKNNQVPLAHFIMEGYIGRYLRQDEVIHHKDLNPSNNSIDNLQLMALSEHVKLHNTLRRRDKYGKFLKNMS